MGGFAITHLLLGWSIFIPVLHVALVVIFRALNWFPQETRKRCRGSDIVALELVSTVCVVFVATAGVLGYFNFFDVMDNQNLYTIEKFYGYSKHVEDYLVTPMLCYQLWNLVACLLHNEYRDLAGIGHHIVTSGLAYMGFHPYAQYYALFYFGVAELTTIPLNAVTIFKHLPHLSTQYPFLYQLARNSFVVSYFIVRIFWWPVVSYELFFGCIDLLTNNKAHSTFVVCYFLFANMFLTGLQFYWGYLIVRKALRPARNKTETNKEK